MENNKETFVPFEKKEKVKGLSILITIVNRNLSNAIVKEYIKLGASCSFTTFGHSLPPIEILEILGGEEELGKDIVFTIINNENMDKFLKYTEERFNISDKSKGIAFTIPIDSVAGAAVYKYLSDFNKDIRRNKYATNK